MLIDLSTFPRKFRLKSFAMASTEVQVSFFLNKHPTLLPDSNNSGNIERYYYKNDRTCEPDRELSFWCHNNFSCGLFYETKESFAIALSYQYGNKTFPANLECIVVFSVIRQHFAVKAFRRRLEIFDLIKLKAKESTQIL